MSRESDIDRTPFENTVIAGLDEAVQTYIERNAVYKDNFRNVGNLVQDLFPEGVSLRSAEDFTRWHIFELFLVKLTRYAKNYKDGGHEDSLKDMTVYLSILQALDAEMASKSLPVF